MVYLRLIRLPNIFTALADIWAGYFFCLPTKDCPDWTHLTILLFTSGFLYAAGIVLNDVFDIKWDKIHHSERPLPSNHIPIPNAILLVLVLFALAFLAVSSIGGISLYFCIGLILCIVIYNKISKKELLVSAIMMGLCRSLNFLLGASGNVLTWKMAFIPASLLGLYIVFVTLISQMEDSVLSKTRFKYFVVGMLSIPLLSTFLYQSDSYYQALPVIVLLTILIGRQSFFTYRQLTPTAVGKVIKMAILAIILLDAGWVIGNGHLFYGIICLCFIIPPTFLSKAIKMT